jgi:hypothetical protein
MGCGPERIDVGNGQTRPAAHGLGNLKVCSEDGDGSRAYFDPYAFQYNFKSSFEKLGPAGIQKALEESARGTLSGTENFGATKASQAAAVEQALRTATAANHVAKNAGLPTKPVQDIIGKDLLKKSTDKIGGLPGLPAPINSNYGGSDEEGIASLLRFANSITPEGLQGQQQQQQYGSQNSNIDNQLSLGSYLITRPRSAQGGGDMDLNSLFGGSLGGNYRGNATGSLGGGAIQRFNPGPGFQGLNNVGGSLSNLQNPFGSGGSIQQFDPGPGFQGLFGNSSSFTGSNGGGLSGGGDIFGGGGGGGGGILDGLGGLGGLAGGALIAGGLASLFGGGNDSKVTQTNTLPPPTAAELMLLGINVDLATQQLQAFREQSARQGVQNDLVEGVFRGELGISFDPAKVQQARSACDTRHGAGSGAAETCFQSLKQQAAQEIIAKRDFDRSQIEGQRNERLGQLNQQQDQLGQLALQDAQQGTRPLTPEQQANLTGAADLAIQGGLSDIGRFRDESLNQIRQNSVTRGLRPGDTPVANDFHDVGIESGRLAQNFVGNIRSQQLNSQLTLPFQESELRGQRLGLASDLALRRSTLEESLLESARNARLGLASGVQGTGLGLATGTNAASAFGTLTSARQAGASSSQRSSGGNDLATTLGGIGGLLTGLGNTGIFGNNTNDRRLF